MINRRISTIAHLAVGITIALGLVGCGCGHSSDSGDKLSDKQNEAGDRMSQIIKKSNGDYDKLEPKDKAWLINTMAGGNEQAAKMMFAARTGHAPSAGPGSSGPPKAGPLGGPTGAPSGAPQAGPGGPVPRGGPGGGMSR